MLLRSVLMAVLLMFVVLGCSQLADAAWVWETQVVTSPFHDLRLHLSELGYSWQVQEELQLSLHLPVQYAAQPGEGRLELLAPRASVTWAGPADRPLSGELALALSPRKELCSMRAGVKMVTDPMAVKFGLVCQDGLSLQAGAAFAVNERWALAAHLRYRKNSLLTYELHHNTSGDAQLVFSYTRALDGTMQSLGVKIAF
ncbi:MAG TPA: hypothetical protein GX393_03830 [Firmicutes bacterium]|jgi:hypothetical protein|nr:hypothetical protein [Bacillota bacterium]